MEGIVCTLVIALLATTVFCIPEERMKRSYDNAHGGGSTGFGADSDEIDNASLDDAPCGLRDDNSGSPEHGFDFDQHPGQESHRGYSVKAAAAASSSTYS